MAGRKQKARTSEPQSGPVKPGSTLYRLLELLAARVAARLRQNTSGK